MMSRRRLFSFLGLPGVAFAQAQVNATTQIKNLASGTGPFDNWIPIGYAGAINGLNLTFIAQIQIPRKLTVHLNGVYMAQASEPQVVGPNISVVGNTITFIGPIPQQGDNLSISYTL